MNSEEQQHLKTNDFSQTVQAIGQQLEAHAVKIVAAIGGIGVIAVVILLWSWSSHAAAAKAWTLLESARTVDDFGAIHDAYKGTVAGRWARLRESEIYQQTGLSLVFNNRELALTDLKKAKEGFEQLVSERSGERTIQERALWGLATILETTSDGDTSKAVECYQRLLDEVPDTFYKGLAEQRISALKTGGAKEFYAWFSKQNPKPVEPRPKDAGAKDDIDSMLGPHGKSEFDIPSEKGGKVTKGALKPEDSVAPEPTTPAANSETAPPSKEGEVKGEEKSGTEKPAAENVSEQKSEQDKKQESLPEPKKE